MKFLGYLLWFQRYKFLHIYIFNSVWQQLMTYAVKFRFSIFEKF